jgi:soluble lytic murein transglycosylase-like protein
MQNSAAKLKVASIKQPALYYFDTFSFWVLLAFLGINLALSSLARADDLSRAMIKQLVVKHANETRHVDAALALAVARVMSNFDAAAVGPAQRLGIFQLDPRRLDKPYHSHGLLDPARNIKIGLESLDQLIEANKGDVAMALVEFNDGHALGPWPMSRVVDYPGGIVANIFAARAVFELELAGFHQTIIPVIDTTLYAMGSPDDIYPRYAPIVYLPRWRKKIDETRYWLGEADRIRRAGAW